MQGQSGARFMVLCNDNPALDKIDCDIVEAIYNEDYVGAHCKLILLAEEGDANAQVLLGALFQDGWGAKKNYDEAVKWYRSSSEQGHPVAQILLANRYRDGEGVREDPDKMLELYYEAANQNYGTAQYGLAGMCYYTHPPKLIEAYKWAKLAGARLKTSGHKALMLAIVESLEEDLTSEELAEAERLISEWKPTKDLSLRVE